MKITFIKDHKVKQGDGKGPHYKTGETHDLELSYAEKYKRLGLAEDYVAPARAPKGSKGKSVSEPEPLEIRQETDADGKRTLYAVKPWPQVTSLAEELLTAADENLLSVDDGKVTIKVANGFAIYKIGEEIGAGYRACSLIDSQYEEAPEKK